MNKFILTAITAAAFVGGPIAASAEAVAVSLSASFGENLGLVNVADENIAAPTSVSVAGAAGTLAVASAVANMTTSGAAAGASIDTEYAPNAVVAATEGGYETNVSFVPTNFDEIAIAAAQAEIAALCEAGFDVTENLTSSTPLFVPIVGTVNFPGAVNGTIEVTCAE